MQLFILFLMSSFLLGLVWPEDARLSRNKVLILLCLLVLFAYYFLNKI